MLLTAVGRYENERIWCDIDQICETAAAAQATCFEFSLSCTPISVSCHFAIGPRQTTVDWLTPDNPFSFLNSLTLFVVDVILDQNAMKLL